MYIIDGVIEEIEYIESDIIDEYVYDIEIEDNHNFFTENVLVHNCHTAAAESIWKCGVEATNAYYRYGMSATPWRDDGKDLIIESILNVRKPHLSITASDLIKIGKLTPCCIYFIEIKERIDWTGDYNSFYKNAIINNINRNKKIVELAKGLYNSNKTTLILIKNIEHGNLLLSMINNFLQNNTAEFLSGSDNTKTRETILNNVKNGKTKILIASTIADQGLDLPILDSLILAGGGRSSTRAFQRVGRVLRLYEGKKEATVFDFKDMSPTLYTHYLYRKALYETEPLWKIKEVN